jgi:hypothetical protein
MPAPTKAIAPSHRPSRPTLVVVAVAVFVLTGTLAWLAFSRMLPARGTETPLVSTFTFIDQYGRPISGRSGVLKLVLDPFTVYANWPNQQTAQFTIDGRGFRSTPPAAGGRWVALLGGSAAFGWQLPSDRSTLAWQLAERLPGLGVINAGVVGHQSGQELAMMVHRLDRPGIVAYVAFDGWNDLFDGYLDAYPVRRPLHLLGVNNAFFQIQDRLHEHYLKTDGRVGVRAAPGAPPARLDEPAYLEAITETYLRNLGKMQAYATARGAVFLAVFQPELGQKLVPTAGEASALARWDLEKSYLRHRFTERYAAMMRQARAYCEARGIGHVDLLNAPEIRAATGSLFYDPVHLNERGQVIVAEILERRLARAFAAVPPRSASGTRNRPS